MKLRLALLFLMLPFMAMAKGHVPKSIYDFKVAAHDGSTIDFSQFKGKKILIVNTTAYTPNNPQYAELEALSKKYAGKLVIIGMLTRDFATPPDVKRNANTIPGQHYDVTFPLSAFVMTRGDDCAPIYTWLTEKNYNLYQDTEVKWDFQKYLVNEQGQLVAEFDPKVRVTDPKVIAAIEQ